MGGLRAVGERVEKGPMVCFVRISAGYLTVFFTAFL